jgi:hypothetical protein
MIAARSQVLTKQPFETATASLALDERDSERAPRRKGGKNTCGAPKSDGSGRCPAIVALGRFSRSLRPRQYWTMLTADLEDFVRGHRPHGPLVPDAGALTPNGYRLSVACPCGVTFERWITPEEAARDLAKLARLN